jgi:hypothetical protein
MKKYFFLILLVLLFSEQALASSCETLDCIVDGFVPQLEASKSLISSISYIAGLIFGYKGIVKLKEHNESKGQVKLSVGLLYLISCALLVGLPTVIVKGRQTVGLSTSVGNN